MRPTRTSKKILSVLSMAVAAALSAKAASGATLTLYYGNDPSYANSNNNVDVASGLNKNSTTPDAQGQFQYLTGAVTPAAINAGGPTTINLGVGSYLSLSIDAVLTGNHNPDAGVTLGEPAQSAFLGLSSLAMGISSTDQSATFLTPLALNNTALSSFQGATTYNGFAELNNSANSNTTNTIPIGSKAALAQNNGDGGIPEWDSIASPPDVSPHAQDGANANGNVGLNGFLDGSNTRANPTSGAGNLNELQQFAPQSNAASYATATEFGDSIMFQGLSAGTVTLQPYIMKSMTSYWTVQTPAHTLFGDSGSIFTIPSAYYQHILTAADTINNLPSLVIQISVPEPASVGLLALGAVGLLSRRNRGKS